jgi:hypothetical protein
LTGWATRVVALLTLGTPGGGAYRRKVRSLLATVVGFVIAALTVLALAGSSRLDGPVLVVLSDRHGLHRGDLTAVTLAAVGLLTLVALHRRTRHRPTSAPHEDDRVPGPATR